MAQGKPANAGSPPIFAPGDAEETAETTESPLDAEVYDLIAKHKQKTDRRISIQTESSASGRRAQSKPKSVLRIFVEIDLWRHSRA